MTAAADLQTTMMGLMARLKDFQDNTMVRHTWNIGTTLSDAHRDLIKHIHKVTRALPKWTAEEQQAMAKTYDIVLYRVYDVFLGKLTHVYIPEDVMEKTRGPVDALMKKFGIKKAKEYFLYLATRTFLRFAKGITYFRDEDPVDKPAYHREASCGDRWDPAQIKFQATWNPDADEATRESTRRRVHTCYVERLMYDKLYHYYIHEQDIRHLAELLKVARIHETWYPNTTVDVRVFYQEDFFPYECVIEIRNTETGHTVTEPYTKRPWHREAVFAQKVVRELARETVYSKIQTFDGEMPWEVVSRRASRGGFRLPAVRDM